MHERLDAGDAERIGRRGDAAIAAATRTGSHLWATLVAYRIADPASTDAVILDRENLLTYPMVGCFICEKPYSGRLARRRCTGDPAR